MEHFIEAFIRQAEQNPDNIAVLDGHGSYSYGELNRRSAFLADFMIKALGWDQAVERIALLLPRTKEFITAWLAVLRAGFTVIPLSDEYPAERIAAILHDADCRLCLTTDGPALSGMEDVPVVLLDKLLSPGRKLPVTDLQLNRSRPDAEGMIFYTSGSTGNPKGVVHLHRILDAYPELLPQAVSISSKTRTLSIALFTFAASLIDLTPPLYYGGSIYIAGENERKDVKQIYRIINDCRISGSFFPPALYELIHGLYGVLPLEYLFLSGEKAREQVMFGDPGVFELYGASECPPMLINPLGNGGPASLGRPYDGVKAFLRDDDGREIREAEVIGELCVITPYMAVGYHKLPEETGKKFGKTDDQAGNRVYYTGDYMAFAADGTLVFHGRKDRMVKIRGQRVELGEIDYVISRFSGITEARTVNVTLQNTERLVCYYTGSPRKRRELREYAEKYLADYMVPDFFIHLDEMPRNKRNKTDYQALKAREIDNAELLEERMDGCGEVSYSDETEQRICAAAAGVLGLPSVGPEESFFDIGGTSLLAMQLALELDELNLSVKDIYTHKTPRRLAKAARGQLTVSGTEETETGLNRAHPLQPYQRYYVDYQLYSPKGDGQNVPVLKAMPRSEISPDELKEAMEKIMHHFSIFSTVFTFTDDGLVQRCEPQRIMPVEITETSDAVFEQEIIPHLLKPHRVINSLLYRCGIYATETRVCLFMDFHHSIIDGGGMNLLLKNIVRVLHGEEPEKESYYDYLRQMEVSAGRQEQDAVLERMRQTYNLPSFDRLPRKDHESRDNRIHSLPIPCDYSYSGLMDTLEKKNVTVGMLFNAAVLLALKEYNGSDRVQVQWVYNARDEKWKQNVVGITMSALPIAVDFGRPGLDLFREIRTQIAENIACSDLSFALCDNSPGMQDNLNIISEDGKMEEAQITPGTQEINLWGYRQTSPADVECMLIPELKENRMRLFINYNRCCYEEASIRRFCEYVADSMRLLIGQPRERNTVI